MIRGQSEITGDFRSCSHPIYVHSLISSARATCFWKSPSSRRRFLRCCPKVFGSKSVSLRINELSVTQANGKKATRLCRCGHLADAERACSRAPKCARDYQNRISGPMFDRIDMHIEVPAVAASDLRLPPPAEGSAEVAARVLRARNIQITRYRALAPKGKIIRSNSEADGELLQAVAQPDAAGEALLGEAAQRRNYRHAVITECCAWRARWPISKA